MVLGSVSDSCGVLRNISIKWSGMIVKYLRFLVFLIKRLEIKLLKVILASFGTLSSPCFGIVELPTLSHFASFVCHFPKLLSCIRSVMTLVYRKSRVIWIHIIRANMSLLNIQILRRINKISAFHKFLFRSMIRLFQSIFLKIIIYR